MTVSMARVSRVDAMVRCLIFQYGCQVAFAGDKDTLVIDVTYKGNRYRTYVDLSAAPFEPFNWDVKICRALEDALEALVMSPLRSIVGKLPNYENAVDTEEELKKMNEKKNTVTGGIGITGLLQVAFIVLKLCGVIKWSWLWVLAPTWGTIAFALLAVLVGLILIWISNKV